MKKLVIVTFLLSVTFLSANGQKSVPENIKKEFMQKYPEAKVVKWDNEEGNEWEAGFQLNGKEMSASYDMTGRWLESEAAITFDMLPPAAQNTIKTDYSGFKPVETLILENPQMKGYEVVLKKGNNRVTIVFKSDGTILKKVS